MDLKKRNIFFLRIPQRNPTKRIPTTGIPQEEPTTIRFFLTNLPKNKNNLYKMDLKK
jgi:hypothetical protein